MEKDNIILIKSFDFALEIIHLYRFLIRNKEYVLSKQLLKSGTSIGANVEEAVAAYSRSDFSHKMSIASKEARETRYWLRLLHHSKLIDTDYTPYLHGVDELIKILTSIVKTTQSHE